MQKEEDVMNTIEINKVSHAEDKTGASVDVMLITGDQLGSGDEILGSLLMTAFINTLADAAPKPARMIFINRGVMLTTEGSRVLDTLQQLEKEAVEILSCGTCLNHYQIKEKLRVGQVTNMYDTVNSLLTAGKVVRI
jgi:selenium metabolism protein YedF